MKLIIGLGNPEKKYKNTRHNVGFRVIDVLSEKLSIRTTRKECFSLLGENKEIILAKPQTYMNSSGDAVECVCKKFNIELSDIAVICDDLDLPLGKIRIRFGGSSGGHKGVQSIIDKMQSGEFLRIKVGISGEVKPKDAINYVLSDFSGEEEGMIAASIIKASEAAVYIKEGNSIEEAMNKFN